MVCRQYLTRSHDVVRRWAAAHDARPATVADTHSADDPGVIRLEVPGQRSGDRLVPIGWDEWFAKFDDARLVLLYQETAPDGAPSGFSRLLEADAAEAGIPAAEWIDAGPEART